MAHNAFDAMNESASDEMYLTGGAISVSEYEQNMSPEDQTEYEGTLMKLFQTAYQNDILLRKYPNVSFKHWLTTIDGDDWRYRAEDYDASKKEYEGSFSYMGDAGELVDYHPPEEFNQNEQIYLLQRLAHLHTGLIEDLVTIVTPLVQEEVGGPPQGMPQLDKSASFSKFADTYLEAGSTQAPPQSGPLE